MVNMYEVLQSVVGAPTTFFQIDILYLVSAIVSVMLIMYFLYIFKLLAGIIKPGK